MSRIIGLLMCLASIIWGYYEYQSATMLFGPLIGFLTGLSIVISTFDATDALLRKLLSKYTSEDGRAARDASNRQAMLNRVRDFWVEGVLESSLHEEARIELGLEERRDAVAERPWDVILRTQDRPDCVLPPGTKISDVFERVGRSLLILGEPGAGKTTTLLELAREMIDRAERDPSEKIPVVFNLSSWTDPKQTLNEWMAEEMRDNYRIQKKIAETWIENDSILPLLDGLDEVANERRAACVDVINGYLDRHSAQAVICCRKEEYGALDAKLKLQSAILLQSLTPEQIDDYLERLSPDLDSLRDALRSDHELQGFAKTPFILSIMTLAYRGMTVEKLQSLGSTEDQRKHLFKTYVDQMFERVGRKDPKLFPKEKTIHWLSWLARKMLEHNQTVFLIERMQPSWLDTKAQEQNYFNSVMLFAFMSGAYGHGLSLSDIKPVEIFHWSWKKGRERLVGALRSCLIVGLFSGLFLGLISDDMYLGLITGLFLGLIDGTIEVLRGGLIVAEMETKTVPNQGTRQSAKNAIIVVLILVLIFGLIGGLIGGMIFGLIGGLSIEPVDGLFGGVINGTFDGMIQGLFLGLVLGLFLGLFFGLYVGIYASLFFGGFAVFQHFNLRIRLHGSGLLPWKLVTFLDYATERIFLRKVGGGYVFVHRMLMEYFASLEPGTGRK